MTRFKLMGMFLAGALAACGNSSGGSSITVPLTAQMTSGQSGTAVLTDNGDTTTVDITTTGGTDTGAQASHIHSGTCGSNGAIILPLNNVQGGRGTTTLNVKLSTLTGGINYINVHNSGNIANIQSCGNIP